VVDPLEGCRSHTQAVTVEFREITHKFELVDQDATRGADERAE
jgi:hypothetical protein